MPQIQADAVTANSSEGAQPPPLSTHNDLPTVDEIDRAVGAWIQQRRLLLGLTQAQLADLVGVAYQQLHKYENGQNRVSAGRLYQLAEALEVEVDYFFQGPGGGSGPAKAVEAGLASLMRYIANMPAQEHREAICYLARALAEDQP